MLLLNAVVLTGIQNVSLHNNGCSLMIFQIWHISMLILFIYTCVFQNSELQKITNEQFVKAVQEVEQKFLYVSSVAPFGFEA